MTKIKSVLAFSANFEAGAECPFKILTYWHILLTGVNLPPTSIYYRVRKRNADVLVDTNW